MHHIIAPVHDGTKMCIFINASAKSWKKKDHVKYKSPVSVFVVF